jgi:hypothetical protein
VAELGYYWTGSRDGRGGQREAHVEADVGSDSSLGGPKRRLGKAIAIEEFHGHLGGLGCCIAPACMAAASRG